MPTSENAAALVAQKLAQIKPSAHSGVDQCEIEDLFASVAPQAMPLWPLEYPEAGYKTEYLQVSLANESENPAFAVFYGLKIQARLSNDKESLIAAQSFFNDDGVLTVRLENLYREQGKDNSRIGRLMIAKLQAFLRAQDKAWGNSGSNVSVLEVTATSNNDASRMANRGGYVWAKQGFDFSSPAELQNIRRHFNDYCAQHQVALSPSELKLFTKPCHFAAFDCGVKVRDKFGDDSSLGKAFLLLHEQWHGVLRSDAIRREENRYALALAQGQTAEQALKQLNSSYRQMLKNVRRRCQNPTAHKENLSLWQQLKQRFSTRR